MCDILLFLNFFPVESRQRNRDKAIRFCSHKIALIPFLSTGSHCRLPAEAEWEYAARAGTSTRFSNGDDPALTGLANNAWYFANSGNMTRPCRRKIA